MGRKKDAAPRQRPIGRHINLPLVCSDPRVDAWIAEECEIGSGLRALGHELAIAFAQWCKRLNGTFPPFGFLAYHLAVRGFIKRRVTLGFEWLGIAMRSKVELRNAL